MTAPKKTAATKAAPESDVEKDIEEIVPIVGELTVKGVPCTIRRIKTLEFIALIRVLTTGLGGSLGQVRLDFQNEETITQDLSALMLLAIPNATEEFSMLLRQMVEPKDEQQRAIVAGYLMDNPDLDALIDIFEVIATQEKDDMKVLAGKLQAAWSRVVPLYTRQTAKR